MTIDENERGRQEAETGRVVAEGERVRAEGADGHETELGRVQAEEGRVSAEEGRAKQHRERAQIDYRRILALVAIPLALIVVIPSLYFNVRLWDYAQENRDRANDALIAREALCSFKSDLKERLDSTKQYLADVKDGKRPRIEGLTDGDIKLQIEGRQSTYNSLSILECNPSKEGK